jgi:hypothetical protein
MHKIVDFAVCSIADATHKHALHVGDVSFFPCFLIMTPSASLDDCTRLRGILCTAAPRMCAQNNEPTMLHPVIHSYTVHLCSTSLSPAACKHHPAIAWCPSCCRRWTLLPPAALAAAGLSRPRRQQQQKSSMAAAVTASPVTRQGSIVGCAAACGLTTSRTGWQYAAAATGVCTRAATQRWRVRCRQQQLQRYDRTHTLIMCYL